MSNDTRQSFFEVFIVGFSLVYVLCTHSKCSFIFLKYQKWYNLKQNII